MGREENYARYAIFGLVLTILLAGALGVAFASESSRINRRTEDINKRRIRNGRALFVENCTSCHGSRGEGAVGPALNSKRYLAAATEKTLFATIRAGRPNTTMPAWGQDHGGPLTDEDIRDIVAFIRAWEPTAPTLEATRFVPSSSRGASLYASTCFICHGENGLGGKAPALNDRAKLARLDDAWYRQTIANGRPAKGMPTWGTVLSPNQIEDLVALVKAWRGGDKVNTESTVAEYLRSAVFALSQGDVEDATFYLDRAKPIAFGPVLAQFEPIQKLIADKKLNDALTALGKLNADWPIGDALSGATVFGDACASCHGSQGQGGVGRRLAPSKFVADSTNAELLNFLLQGRTGTAMRSFQGVLTEKQLADTIAHLRAWQPASPTR